MFKAFIYTQRVRAAYLRSVIIMEAKYGRHESCYRYASKDKIATALKK